ncbi:MAG: phosphoribosylglycinamide formyltransferase [Gammaproteobacteria bacterium]
MTSTAAKLPVVVLISGRGSNFKALLECARAGELDVEVRAVVSNRGDAAGLETARHAGLPVRVVEHKGFDDREAFDRALADCIDEFDPALVILAGFMRVLTPGFVRRYDGRLLNIHPSLLPRHPGLDTHARAISSGDSEHGASVHLVNEEVDGGPVLAQVRVPIHTHDDAMRLAARVLVQEHQLLPLVVQWFAHGRIRLDSRGVLMDGEHLLRPLQFDEGAIPPLSPREAHTA